jgi:hypothetical protein
LKSLRILVSELVEEIRLGYDQKLQGKKQAMEDMKKRNSSATPEKQAAAIKRTMHFNEKDLTGRHNNYMQAKNAICDHILMNFWEGDYWKVFADLRNTKSSVGDRSTSHKFNRLRRDLGFGMKL